MCLEVWRTEYLTEQNMPRVWSSSALWSIALEYIRSDLASREGWVSGIALEHIRSAIVTIQDEVTIVGDKVITEFAEKVIYFFYPKMTSHGCDN